MNELDKHIEDAIQLLFSEDEIEELAKESKFVQRKGKITGMIFLQLMLFHSKELKDETLTKLSLKLQKEFEITIVEESIQERFNAYAVEFLKLILTRMLEKQLTSNNVIDISAFKRILIKDSTCFQIDEKFVEQYKGSGGSGSKASVRIQFEYDLLTGDVTDVSLHPFVDQDASNSSETTYLIKKDDLIIRDLAYMSIPVLKEIIKINAFFLCRLNTEVTVYEKDEKGELILLRFTDLLKQMTEQKLNTLNKNVYLKKGTFLKVCLVIYRLPDDIVNKRIRESKNKKNKNKRKKQNKKSKKQNKRKGKKVSKLQKKEKIARLHFNLMITNTDNPCIETLDLYELYRIRWQIELIFKCWKSVVKIDKIKKVKLERLECYIFSRILFILLTWRISWAFTKTLYRAEKKIVSYIKCVHFLLENKNELLVYGKGDPTTRYKYIESWYKDTSTHNLLEVKKGDTSTWEIVLRNIF